MLLRLKGKGAFPVLFIFSILLSGCGFQPLYPVDQKRDIGVYVDPIQDREGQILRHHLQTLFSEKTKKSESPYVLTVSLTTHEEELGFRRDETSRRTRITLTAQYVLKNRETEEVLVQQEVSVLTGYSTGSKSSFASFPLIVSKSDSVKRGLSQLARDIHISIYSFLVSDEAERGVRVSKGA